MGFPLAWRLLRRKRGFFFVFVGLYALGLSLYLAVDALSRNAGREIAVKARENLEGELRIFSRRPFTAAESIALAAELPPGAVKAEVWAFLSMIRKGEKTRMVSVRAISPEYPLFGSFAFRESLSVRDLKSGEALVPPELLSALSLGTGDSVQVGERFFRIRGVYTQRPGNNISLMELGSRIYIPLADMNSTGLDQKGSRIFRYRFYRFDGSPAVTSAIPGQSPAVTSPLPTASPADVAALKKRLDRLLSDPEMEVAAYTDSGSDLGRSLEDAAGFLKMVTLTAFLLAALGAAFFFHHHLAGERKTIALLQTLGASNRRILGVYLVQNLLLCLFACLLSFVLAYLLSLLLPLLVRRLFGLELSAGLPASLLLQAPLLAVLTGLLFNLSGFAGILSQRPGLLLKPVTEKKPGPSRGRLRSFLARLAFVLLILGYFFAIAFLNSRSYLLSALFVGSMAVSFLLLLGLGIAIYRLALALSPRLGYGFRVLLGSFRLAGQKVLAAFAALGLVAFSSSLLPQLQQILIAELSAPEGHALPQLFLFDIQEEQLEPLMDFLEKEGARLDQVSPMVRARLETVNGKAFMKDTARETSVEDRNRREFRNRGFNLSYRDSLSSAEKLVEGRLWSGPFVDTGGGSADGAALLPGVSVEEKFAERVGLALGDTLAFDVQGVPVSGTVSSFRKVRWATFQPNFFVLFQPGALDLAPKTFLGTLRKVSADKLEPLQARMVERFPNVTALDLRVAIGKTVDLLGRIRILIGFLSGFALLVGLVLLFLIAHILVEENRRTLLLLRVLGAGRPALIRLLLLQYLVLAVAAGLTGYGLSLAGVFAINAATWQMPWSLDLRYFGFCLLASFLVGLLLAAYALFREGKSPLRSLLAEARG